MKSPPSSVIDCRVTSVTVYSSDGGWCATRRLLGGLQGIGGGVETGRGLELASLVGDLRLQFPKLLGGRGFRGHEGGQLGKFTGGLEVELRLLQRILLPLLLAVA